jgi:CHC2 zinc finger
MKSVLAEYIYRDPAGRILRKKLRHPGKEFSWQTFDQVAGQWFWGAWPAGSATSTLYDLDKLQPGLVWITEGEKDTDAVTALSLTAVTSGNAGSWLRHHSEQLKQAGVTLAIALPDNDQAGRNHAYDVTRENLAVGIPSKIIRLPNLSHGEDVSDFIERGGSRMDLIGLAKSAKLVTPADLPTVQPPSTPARGPHRSHDPRLNRVYRDALKLSVTRGHHMVPCPFHVDANPSFSLDLDRGLWYCHGGCGGGGPAQFYMALAKSRGHVVLRTEAWKWLERTYLK